MCLWPPCSWLNIRSNEIHVLRSKARFVVSFPGRLSLYHIYILAAYEDFARSKFYLEIFQQFLSSVSLKET